MNVQLPASRALPVLPCSTCQEHALAGSARCASRLRASAGSAMVPVSQPAALNKSSAVKVFVPVGKEGCPHTLHQSVDVYRVLCYRISTCPVSALYPCRMPLLHCAEQSPWEGWLPEAPI